MTLKENTLVVGLAASFGYDRDRRSSDPSKSEEAQWRGDNFAVLSENGAHVRHKIAPRHVCF